MFKPLFGNQKDCGDKPESVDCYMITQRTTVIPFVYSNFVGTIIHLSVENWEE
jgi:hypothetical protein